MYLNGETDKIGEKDVNSFITDQNNKNIAEQAHGFVGVNNAMKEYNKLSDAGAKNKLADEIKNTNQSLGTYLSNLDNANAGMGGYCQSLMAAKAGTMALEVATTAMNAVIGMGVSLIITGIVNAISNWIHADERLAESAKTAAENISNTYSSFNEMKSSTGDIKKEFAELSQHVDQLTGKNRDLSTEQYARFLELSNQLADSLPNIGYSIDENGNKIVGLTGGVNDITQSIDDLISAEETLANQKIAENMDDVFAKAYNDMASSESQKVIYQLEGQNTIGDVKEDMNKLLAGEQIKFSISTQADDAFFTDIQELFDGVGLKLNNEFGVLSLNQTGEFADLTEEEIQALENGADRIQQKYADYNNRISDGISNADENIKATMSALWENMGAWLTTDGSYKTLVSRYGGELGSAVQNVVKSVEWTHVESVNKASDNKKFDMASDWVEETIMKPLINADSSEIRQAYIKLFTNQDIPIDSAISYYEQIEDYYEKHDMEIPVVFEDKKEKAEDTKERFDTRNKNFESGNKEELKNFFQKNGITSEETYDQWLDVTLGITDATMAMRAWNNAVNAESSSKSSFSESWSALADEDKNNLLELARAGEISDATLTSSETYNTLLKNTGLSAKEARNEIMNMISEQEKLSGFKNKMDSLVTLYNEFKEKKFVSAESLNGLPDVFKEMNDGKDFDIFSKIVGDPTSGKEKIQGAFNDLVSSYIKDQNILDGTTKKTKGAVIANLGDAGITNAQELVDSYVSGMKQIDKAKDEFWQQSSEARKSDIKNFQVALKDKNTSFTDACNVLGTNNAALINSMGEQYATDYINWLDLLDKKKDALREWKAAASDADKKNNINSTNAYTTFSGIKNKKNNYDAAKKEERKARKKLGEKYGTKSIEFDKIKFKPTKTSKNTSQKTSTTKQTFDWLERKITVVTKQLDYLKAKIENVFSAGSKNSILDREIKNLAKLKKSYGQQAKIYRKQAKASAKSGKTTSGQTKARLTGRKGKKLQKLVRKGKFRGKTYRQLSAAYGGSTATAIQEYQEYWDKYLDAKTNVQSARTQIREAKIQKHQYRADAHDARTAQYDAAIENKATAAEKNKLAEKKISHTKASYKQQIAIAKKKYGRKSAQVAELKEKQKKAVRDIRVEQQEYIQEEADAKTAMYEAWKDNSASAAGKNHQLQQERQWISKSYDAQIKAAEKKYGRKSAQADELRQKKIKELRDNETEQLQNLADEKAAQYELNQLQESNASGAGEKNRLEQKSRNLLNEQYGYEIDIAKKNGDITEEKRLQEELAEKTRNSYQKELENIREEYNLLTGLNEAKKSTIESRISALQANGYGITAEMYREQQRADLENYQKKLEEIAQTEAKLAEGNLTGDALRQELTTLESLRQEAWACEQSWGEIQQKINDLNLSKIERTGKLLEYQAGKLEYIQDILSHSDFTLSDKETGGLTMEGLSNAAITLGQIRNNNGKIANYYAQIAEIRRQIDSGEYVGGADAAYEQINALLENIRELEKGNYDFGESIKSLVVDSLNSLSGALEENISKYKEALQTQKDLYDYRKKVTGQLKSIASLEKQLAALEGDQSEEARARIRQIQMSLEDERDNLEETEYDKYIRDQEDMLDKLMDDFGEFIAGVADTGVSEICEAVGNAVTDNAGAIIQSITDAFSKSSKIGEVADSVTGLKETIEKLDFSTGIRITFDDNGSAGYEYTDKNGSHAGITSDEDGTITGSSTNGRNNHIPDKSIAGTENDMDTATTEGAGKARIQNMIDSFDEHARGRHSDYNTNYFLRYLYDHFRKTPTDMQEFKLRYMLGLKAVTDDEYAVNRLKELGFSHGGIASKLNKVALDNGDDGWVTIQKGEAVLNSQQTKQFKTLTNNLVPLNAMMENVRRSHDTAVPIANTGNTTTIQSMDIHLDGSKVIDTDSFIKTMHNPKVLKEVSNGVSSQIGTSMSNILGKF